MRIDPHSKPHANALDNNHCTVCMCTSHPDLCVCEMTDCLSAFALHVHFLSLAAVVVSCVHL